MVNQIGPFRRRSIFLLCIVFIVAVSAGVGMTVSANVIKIDSGTSINTTIRNAGNGDIIILNPGIYNEHDIVITKNITIRANSSAGGSPANTIIDGQNAGRIIDNGQGYALTIDNLSFVNGNATGYHDDHGYENDYGGGIFVSYDGGIVKVTSSSFSNCSAAQAGGAIAATDSGMPCCSHPSVTVLSSTFSNCSAPDGNAIFTDDATTAIHFSRFYPGTRTKVVSGAADATNNWWGSNDDPVSQVQGAVYTPWLVLNAIATPSTVMTSGTSVVEANFTYNSEEQYLDPALGHLPDGIPGTYSTTTGSVLPVTGRMANGKNTTLFSASDSGNVIVNVTVDGQTVSTGDQVTAPRVSAISPSSGTSYGGTPVTITGLRFTSVTGVSFGTTPASRYTVDSDSQISAVSPAHALGIVNVTVTTDHGPSIPTAADQYTYIPPAPEFAINPGDSIQTAIDCSSPGYTMILNPGTYKQHDIVVTKNITIRANTSAGGNAANTIIDGENAGRVIDDSTGYSLTIDNLSFINGYATHSCYVAGACNGIYGGAIVVSSDGTANITSSSFYNCSAFDGGGAIAATGELPCCTHPGVTVISSTFSNCTAHQGDAIYASTLSTTTIHYSRIYPNTGTYMVYGTVDATNNWWGTNSNPAGHVSGAVTTGPWLVLGITATPETITTALTSTVQANLTYDSDGTYHDPALGHVPDAIPITYAVTSGSGSDTPDSAGTLSGISQTLFTPSASGIATVTATLDGQTVSELINVTGGVKPPMFKGFTVTALCPVEISITDPEGHTINKLTNEIPGATYTELGLGSDGTPDAQIVIPERKVGDYLITVTPKTGVVSTATFSLQLTPDGESSQMIANSVPVSEIPSGPYVLRVTSDGKIVIIGSGNTPVPEFPSDILPATLIIGILGAVLFIQRTRE